MRLLEISFPDTMYDRTIDCLEGFPGTVWTSIDCDDSRRELKVLIPSNESQPIMDKLEALFSNTTDWRIVALPVEAAIPKQNNDEEESEKKAGFAPREEIYQDVSSSAELNTDFIILSFLSAVVAAIGVNTDNVAIVIGAMVIAPLLGPLLAFSFGAGLGDIELMARSAKTALVGLAVGFATAILLGTFLEINLQSTELTSRTDIGFDSVILALAAGAAAALSITTGLSSALVGVMVAVALLPPSVAVALFLAAGEFGLSTKAALLLATNVICVILASQLVFVMKGIRPRTWLERNSAKKSKRINFVVWGFLLLAVVALIMLETT